LINKTSACQLAVDNEPVEFSVADYALSTDLAVARAVSKIPILPTVAEFLISHWNKPIERAKLLGDGVRVGPGQLQSIHRIVSSCADALGVGCPELYIKQDPTFNAYTLGTNQDHVVIVHSSLVDAFHSDELAFIIGHELGHIRSQHVTYSTIGYFLTNGLVALAQPLIAPLVVALNAWSREAEVTADRAGYLASQSPDAALRALVLLAVGSRKLLPEIDLSTYLAQARDLKGFYGNMNLWFGGYNHPYLVHRASSLMEFIFSQRGQAAASRIARTAPMYSRTPTATAILEQPTGMRLPAPQNSAYGHFCRDCGFEAADPASVTCIICGSKIR
jgi:Zn-dependent protease with chaperone function